MLLVGHLHNCEKIDDLRVISTTVNNDFCHDNNSADVNTPVFRRGCRFQEESSIKSAKHTYRSFRVFEEDDMVIISSSPKTHEETADSKYYTAPELENHSIIAADELTYEQIENSKSTDDMDRTTDEKFVVNLFESRNSKRWKRNSFLTSSKKFEQVRNERNISLPTESLFIEESKAAVKDKLQKYKCNLSTPKLQTSLSKVIHSCLSLY